MLPPNPGILGREDEVTRLIELLSRRDRAVPCVVSPPGRGRTALLGALAARLADPAYRGRLSGLKVVRIDAAAILDGAEVRLLDQSLGCVTREMIVAIDDLDVLVDSTSYGLNAPMVNEIRAQCDNPQRRVILLMPDSFVASLRTRAPGFAEGLTFLELGPLDEATLHAVADHAVPQLADFHEVKIPPEALSRALEPETPGSPRRAPRAPGRTPGRRLRPGGLAARPQRRPR